MGVKKLPRIRQRDYSIDLSNSEIKTQNAKTAFSMSVERRLPRRDLPHGRAMSIACAINTPIQVSSGTGWQCAICDAFVLAGVRNPLP